jgi:hypothetical protein
MVAPTGQRPEEIVRNFLPGHTSFPVYYRRRVRWWQAAPFNLVLPYVRQECSYDIGGSIFDPGILGSPYTDAEHLVTDHLDSYLLTQGRNKAYDKFRGKLYDTASLGVDFAEYRQSLSMMASSVGTLIRFTKAVKRLDFLAAAQILKMHIVPPKVSRKRAWSNNWLEYHFGWEPLVRDIHDACDVLNNPLKRFEATRATRREYDFRDIFVNYGSVTRTGWWRTQYALYQGGTVRTIENATLHSLDQFGVINPATILWELVPFSFVVDWFANVGQVLASLTDFAGMTLENTYSGTVFRTQQWTILKTSPGFSSTSKPRIERGSSVYMSRVTGLTSPVFSVKRLTPPSKERAATAIALLVQQLAKR